MAAIDDLIAQIDDPALRERVAREVAELQRTRKFGLVFEQHLPELLPIYSATPRAGDLVGKRGEALTATWLVLKVDRKQLHGIRRDGKKAEILELSDVVVVRQFGDPIFPALVPMDKVQNGHKDAPWHTLIEADNYHALQLLEYLYAGQVDCIYIDPPYNSGASDWKYNNDYIDSNDQWRHSKWLAMMQRRLLLAKRLLHPDNAVLLITIDDNEVHHLNLLLEQLFPECERQMASITISPRGKSRDKRLSQVDEYLVVVYIGTGGISDLGGEGNDAEVRWRYLRRNDIESARGTSKGGPNQFYPIYVEKATQRIVRIGSPLTPDQNLEDVPRVAGAVPVFPIREDGAHMNWGLTGLSLERALVRGYVRVTRGAHVGQPYTFAYLTAPNIKKVEAGIFQITGTRADGSKIVAIPGGKESRPTTAWRKTLYDAGAYGTGLLRSVLPDQQFPFPKSIYSVVDALRLIVKNKPRALIVDFFAGSGTTLNAVNFLNTSDNGQRRCILVTNNEVSAQEADNLRALSLQPSDAALG